MGPEAVKFPARGGRCRCTSISASNVSTVLTRCDRCPAQMLRLPVHTVVARRPGGRFRCSRRSAARESLPAEALPAPPARRLPARAAVPGGKRTAAKNGLAVRHFSPYRQPVFTPYGTSRRINPRTARMSTSEIGPSLTITGGHRVQSTTVDETPMDTHPPLNTRSTSGPSWASTS